MIKQEDIDRLINLSKTYLRCNLDDNSPDFIPEDLKPGTYRWLLYMYSNMFGPDDKINRSVKLIFIGIFKKLKNEHIS